MANQPENKRPAKEPGIIGKIFSFIGKIIGILLVFTASQYCFRMDWDYLVLAGTRIPTQSGNDDGRNGMV